MLNFREAKLNDLPQLLELEQCVIETERPYNTSIKADSANYYNLGNLISSNDSYLLVVEVENEIVGTGYAQIRDSKASLEHKQHSYLGFIYVATNLRRQGLSSKIIEELIAWSKSKGIYDFYLDVYVQNSSAVKAYEKVGFKPSLLTMKLNIK